MSLSIQAIRGFVDELDQLVARKGASVAVNTDRPEVCELIANRAGYLRLGIELMKAGLAEPRAPAGDAYRVDVDPGYLFNAQSRRIGPLLRRIDDSDADQAQEAFQKGFRGAFILLMGVAAILVAIGFVGVAIWLTS